MTAQSGLELWKQQRADQRRVRREVPRAFAQAIMASDRERLCAAIEELETHCLWPQAIRLCTHLTSVPADMQDALLEVWTHCGDALRGGAASDLIWVDALRVLLPPYTGPAVPLFRGEGAWNRRHRSYGMSWSANVGVADYFASRGRSNYQGGTVLLQAEVPPEAIVCAPARLANGYAEDEFIVDRRRLRRVDVLKRYPPEPSARRAG